MLKDILDNTTINVANSNSGISEGTRDKAEFYLNDLDVSARIDLCPKVSLVIIRINKQKSALIKLKFSLVLLTVNLVIINFCFSMTYPYQ